MGTGCLRYESGPTTLGITDFIATCAVVISHVTSIRGGQIQKVNELGHSSQKFTGEIFFIAITFYLPHKTLFESAILIL